MSVLKDTGWKRNHGSQERDEIRLVTVSNADEHSDGTRTDYHSKFQFTTFECKESVAECRWRGHLDLKGGGELFRVYAPTLDEVKKKLDEGLRALATDILAALGPK